MNTTTWIPKPPKTLEEEKMDSDVLVLCFFATVTKASAKDEAVGSTYSPVAE